ADAFEPSTTVCRPAVDECDIAETCTGSEAACPADTLAPDGDGDGFCDAVDTCPATPDPSQVDDDGDGKGNACDPCNNILPSFSDRQKIVITKLNTPLGDDKLKLKGRFIPFLETPAFDPLNNGVRLILETASGETI